MKRISIAQLTRTITTSAFTLMALGCAAGAGAGTAAAGESRTSMIEEAPAPEGFLTIALKYVTYVDDKAKPVVTNEQYAELTRGMNKLVEQCKVRFRMEEVQQVDPTKYGLNFETQSMDEMDKAREPFQDPARLVVIDTGDWNHGAMGSANAWTAMPGSTPYGAVIEAQVATFSNIVANELGHYLGLDHASDQTNLMNPIIYDDSQALDATQCQTVRDTAQGIWAQSLR